MIKNRKTPLERLNDPNVVLRLFAAIQVACLVGVLLGNWIKSAASNTPYLEGLAPYLLFSWVPTAIVIGIVGIILFKRAERKSR
ncbi:hypothetical protein E3T61_17295 [Cryobacterium lactosi]|uniref:Uncharacterized protein n=1 Tax=Cryobacterium lactosi TaxID=1259202 RepID=A0A4R9BIS9_9MICO|nr:hypothetical protein [Cryobacterium lactosi]TFD85545.1 hypothetical protein E3T61_17295 [Cryobacterium lactosi]